MVEAGLQRIVSRSRRNASSFKFEFVCMRALELRYDEFPVPLMLIHVL